MRRTLALAGAIAFGVAFLCALGAPMASSDITVPMSVQWAFSMGADAENYGPPLVQQDRVYVARNGIIHCLDAVTGAEQWKFKPEKGDVTTAPIASGNIIVVGGSDSALYGLNAGSGTTVWKVGCSGGIAPSPVIVNDLVMLGANQMVYAVEPRTGEVKWVCAMNAPARFGPVTDGSMIYFVGEDSSVQCVDATEGRYRWGRPLVKGVSFFPPVVSSGRVIVAVGDRLFGLARSGGISYSADLPAAAGAAPTVVDGTLYLPAEDGKVYQLSARSGAVLERKTPYVVDEALSSSPCVTESLVVVGSASGLVFALDRTTGAVRWSYRCRAPDQLPSEGASYGIYSPLIAADGALLCVTGSGDLYRFSASAPDSSGPVFGDFEPQSGAAVPGGGWLGITCSIIDDGSGVDPASVKATIDGSPVGMKLDPVTGVAASEQAPLPDGAHVVRITAKDYRGNETSTEWSFISDPAIVSATTPGVPGQAGVTQVPGAGAVQRGR